MLSLAQRHICYFFSLDSSLDFDAAHAKVLATVLEVFAGPADKVVTPGFDFNNRQFFGTRGSFRLLCSTLNISPNDLSSREFLRSHKQQHLIRNSRRSVTNLLRWTRSPSRCQMFTTLALTSQSLQEFPVSRIQPPARYIKSYSLFLQARCAKVYGPVDKPSGQIKSTLGRADLKSSL